MITPAPGSSPRSGEQRSSDVRAPSSWSVDQGRFPPGALLARRNLVQGRGDRRGAFRLAACIFGVLMATWMCKAHFVASMGTFGMFLVAICT